MDDFDDEMTGVPFAPTSAEMAETDVHAEVARLREALQEAVEFAEQDYLVLTPKGKAMMARWRAALAATEVPADMSSPKDRERWLAQWKTREGRE